MEHQVPKPNCILQVISHCFCKKCGSKLKKLCIRVHGVKYVDLDPQNKLVRVTGDTDPIRLARALEVIGYKCEIMFYKKLELEENEYHTPHYYDREKSQAKNINSAKKNPCNCRQRPKCRLHDRDGEDDESECSGHMREHYSDCKCEGLSSHTYEMNNIFLSHARARDNAFSGHTRDKGNVFTGHGHERGNVFSCHTCGEDNVFQGHTRENGKVFSGHIHEKDNVFLGHTRERSNKFQSHTPEWGNVFRGHTRESYAKVAPRYKESVVHKYKECSIPDCVFHNYYLQSFAADTLVAVAPPPPPSMWFHNDGYMARPSQYSLPQRSAPFGYGLPYGYSNGIM